MGKEMKGVILHSHRKPFIFRGIHTIDIKREANEQWNPCKSMIKPKIKENGKVLVSIISGCTESRVLCEGLARQGNSYSRLLRILRTRGYIPPGRRVTKVFIDKGFVNLRVESRKDCFGNGEKIILVLGGRGRSVVRKVMKAKDKLYLINQTATMSKISEST
eukprot:TRINITY_DN9361_c0_g4_i6.p1 TRINITY_DN9361_c0_g4~~TRINITY_DN9361_c0_g4_i6.p1  ORF type:complete len:162 (+),score=28.46 TRINITY_DN9361_c0_g4_i6:115-600(+)